MDHPDSWLPEYVFHAKGLPVSFIHTSPLTKFERATVLGHRGLQIAQNSRPRVVTASRDPLDIAREELQAGSIPACSLGRYLPDGQLIRKSVHELTAGYSKRQ
jgi:DNA-directed RNA polymerase subunit K/omega